MADSDLVLTAYETARIAECEARIAELADSMVEFNFRYATDEFEDYNDKDFSINYYCGDMREKKELEDEIFVIKREAREREKTRLFLEAQMARNMARQAAYNAKNPPAARPRK